MSASAGGLGGNDETSEVGDEPDLDIVEGNPIDHDGDHYDDDGQEPVIVGSEMEEPTPVPEGSTTVLDEDVVSQGGDDDELNRGDEANGEADGEAPLGSVEMR